MLKNKATVNPEVYQDIVYRMVANFPGLFNGLENVSGAELVEWITSEIWYVSGDEQLRARAKYGTQEDYNN